MDSGDLLPLLARVAVSLVAVLGLIYLLQRAAKRRAGGRVMDASRFTVVARQALSRNAGVSVLRVGDEALVVGVTDASVQLLARMSMADFEAPAPTADAVESDVISVREVRTAVTLPQGAAFTPAAALARAEATVPATRSALSGSALSPTTWTSALEVLRERTTRR